MKCPVCKVNVNELNEICPNCKTNFDDYYEYRKKHEIKKDITNADFLNAFAVINLIIFIIGAIVVWGNFSKSIYTKDYGIMVAISILIAGLTLFFLLKTIVDIYRKVEK